MLRATLKPLFVFSRFCCLFLINNKVENPYSHKEIVENIMRYRKATCRILGQGRAFLHHNSFGFTPDSNESLKLLSFWCSIVASWILLGRFVGFTLKGFWFYLIIRKYNFFISSHRTLPRTIPGALTDHRLRNTALDRSTVISCSTSVLNRKE